MFFFWIAAQNELCTAAVECGCGEMAGVLILSWVRAVVKSERRQILRTTVEEDVAQPVGLYNGRVKSVEVSSLCSNHPDIINLFTHVANSTTVKNIFFTS